MRGGVAAREGRDDDFGESCGKVSKLGRNCGKTGPASAWFLVHAPVDDAFEGARAVVEAFAERNRAFVAVKSSQFDDALDGGFGAHAEGLKAAEHFIKHAAEGVNVGRAVHRFGAFKLFGCHVCGSPEHASGEGELEVERMLLLGIGDALERLIGERGCADEAEVGHFHEPFGGDKDVLRLQIAVDEVRDRGGGVAHRVAYLNGDSDGSWHGESALGEVSGEAVPSLRVRGDEFNEEIGNRIEDVHFIGGDDIGVIAAADPCGGFAGEAEEEAEVLREAALKRFCGEGAIAVVEDVYNAHAGFPGAAANLGDGVATAEDVAGREGVGGVGVIHQDGGGREAMIAVAWRADAGHGVALRQGARPMRRAGPGRC